MAELTYISSVSSGNTFVRSVSKNKNRKIKLE